MTDSIFFAVRNLMKGESCPIRLVLKYSPTPMFVVVSRTGQKYDGVEFHHIAIIYNGKVLLNFFSSLSVEDEPNIQEVWLNKLLVFIHNHDLNSPPVQNQCVEWFAHFSDPLADLIRKLSKSLETNLLF